MNRVALSSLIVLAALSYVQASHFRYGSLTWKISNASFPNVVDLSLTMIFRGDYFGAPAVGDSIYLSTFAFGDGMGADVYGIVTNIDYTHNAITTVWRNTHTYPAVYPSSYIPYWSDCCRISDSENNADGDWLVTSNVTIFANGANSSPVSSVLAITTAYKNQVNQIQVGASDPDGGVLTYALSAPSDMGGGVQPTGMTINSMTGMITWDTSGRSGIWSCQVKITDSQKAYSVVDFLIQLIDAPAPAQIPYFISPTPAEASTLSVLTGNGLTFAISAKSDDNSVNLDIQYAALPPGMTITNAAAANPVSRTCSWTPAANQVGTYVVTFQVGTVSRSFSIRVVAAERCGDRACTASENCTTCPGDCGACPDVCGDKTCGPTETCSTCPGDCGVCSYCGDMTCNARENCSSCPTDCGDCPMVIWARGRAGYVVTATSFAVGATINLTKWDGKSTPNKYQAWKYNATTGFITLRSRPDLILGAGPIAQKQKTTLKQISWDFKTAIANKTVNPLRCHEFYFAPSTAGWSTIFNRQFSTSALQTPYMPQNFTDGQIWGYHLKLKGQWIQDFKWETYVCRTCPPASLE